MLLASLILAMLPEVIAQEGICPNYYGPFDPDPAGNESCQNAIPPGTFTLRWAHGDEGNWSWEDLAQVEMTGDVRYILTYNETAQLELEGYEDSTLNGYTGICFANLGPDALVVCLNPEMGANGQEIQQGGPGEGPEQQGQQPGPQRVPS